MWGARPPALGGLGGYLMGAMSGTVALDAAKRESHTGNVCVAIMCCAMIRWVCRMVRWSCQLSTMTAKTRWLHAIGELVRIRCRDIGKVPVCSVL